MSFVRTNADPRPGCTCINSTQDNRRSISVSRGLVFVHLSDLREQPSLSRLRVDKAHARRSSSPARTGDSPRVGVDLEREPNFEIRGRARQRVHLRSQRVVSRGLVRGEARAAVVIVIPSSRVAKRRLAKAYLDRTADTRRTLSDGRRARECADAGDGLRRGKHRVCVLKCGVCAGWFSVVTLSSCGH